MGAWGVDTFDNDDACDWCGKLEGSKNLALVEASLDAVFRDEYLEAPTACDALAACEVVARLRGNWGKQNPYTVSVDSWVRSHPQMPSNALIQKAMEAIDRILADNSELKQLWEEGADEEKSAAGFSTPWLASVADLRNRVEG
ncbi:MAG TPA: DUF4259 domain-containing protein [Phycisphaerae bacterium]|jgi:hypothetical protein